MRGLFFFKKNIKYKKRKYGIELLVTIISALLIFCAITLLYSEQASRMRGSRADGDWHIVLYEQVENLEELQQNEYEIEKIFMFHGHTGRLLCPSHEMDVTVVWYENPQECERVFSVTGTYPTSAKEVLLPVKERFLLGRNVGIGDTVTVRESGEEHTYTVTGFYKLPYDEDMVRFGYQLISKADDSIPLTNAYVLFDDDSDIKGKSERLMKYIGCNEYSLNDERMGILLQGKRDFGKRIGYGAVAGICILLLYQMLRGTFMIHKSTVEREYAIMRSIGANPRMLYGIAITEGMLLAGIGSIVGSLLSYGILQVTLRLSGVSMDVSGLWRYEGGTIGFLTTCLIMFPMLVVLKLVQVRGLLRISIKDGLAGKNTELKRRRKKKQYKNSVTAYLLTSMTRNKGRIVLCGISFVVSIFLYVLMSVMVEDLQYISGYKVMVEPYYDVRVMLGTGYSEKQTTEQLLEEIRALDSVAEAEVNVMRFSALGNVDEGFVPNNIGTEYSIKDGSFERICVAAYNRDEFERFQVLLKEPLTYDEFKDGGGVLVNYTYEVLSDGRTDLSEKRQYSEKKVGDTIQVLNFEAVMRYMDEQLAEGTYSSEKRTEYVEKLKQEKNFLSFKVAATAVSDLYFMDTMYPVFIISEEYYHEIVEHESLEVSEFKVRLKEGYNADELTTYCYDHSAYRLVDYFDYTRVFVERMENSFGIMRSVAVIATAVGIINMVCIVLIDWEVRKKEFAVLRSVGVSKCKLCVLLLIEKSILCVGAGGLGGISAVLMEQLVLSISFDMTDVPYRIPFSELGIACSVLFLVAVAMTIIQMLSVKNKNIAECLKQES